MQFIAPDGHHASAAEASFLTLSHARGKGFWLALYRNLPGFAAVSELAYAFIAAHRPAFFRVSLLLWGRNHEPPRYDLVSFLFLRLFGLVYLSAFVSFAVQAQGLIGSHGILPVAELVDAVAGSLGPERFFLVPMVFWLNDSDVAIQAVCWAGAGLSLLLVVNLLPRLSLFLLYALYLSLFYAGQDFMTFQWDTFLLETGFVALLLSFATMPGIWLLRWLLFRFMFMSGVVKLLSGDPNWWNLSALSYHFLTQPLPTPLAWYAAQLPPGLLKFATGGTFFVELILPFLIFCPRRLRFFSAFGILLLQGCILITGNYNWFNLQTMLLCLPLFDDAAHAKDIATPPGPAAQSRARNQAPRRAATVVVSALALLIVFCSLVRMDEQFGGSPPAVAQAVDGLIEPLHIVSAYGLFAVMTTKRNEIVIEGSYDGAEWRDYEFWYKPGDVARRSTLEHPASAAPGLADVVRRARRPAAPAVVFAFPRTVAGKRTHSDSATGKESLSGQAADLCARAVLRLHLCRQRGKGEGRWWDRRLLGLYFPAVHLKGE